MNTGILVAVMFVLITLMSVYVYGPLKAEYTVKAQVSEGMSASASAREAADKSCSQSGLAENLNNADLGLGPPSSLKKTYVQSVKVSSIGASTVDVTVRYEGIELVLPDVQPRTTAGVAVAEGASLVFRGKCSQGKMTWHLEGGTVPKKYWPKI